jgi:nitrous oxidase accessory protein
MPFILLATWLVTAAVPPRTLTVSPGSALPTLTAGLAAARDGDTIRVLAGEYRESIITIARRVTIQGEGWPVFHGGDHQVFTVTGDDVTIRGLIVRDVSPSATDDRAGIKVVNAHRCRIENNVLLDTFFGIYLSKVSGCLIRNNQVRGSGTTETFAGNAIHSWSSSDLVLEGNVLRGHRDGIYFEFTSNARVRHNTSTGQLRYGLHFMFSNDCAYEDNTFADNRAGVAVMYSHDVVIARNRFERSWGSAAYGLLLKDITDGRLDSNSFLRNTAGLYAEGTTRLTVTGNQFLGNGWGIQVMGNAQQTIFRRNRFEGNSFDVSTNSANAAADFRENYWDRYPGYDLDRDGYGDVPFAPVRLFAFVVQRNEPALILLRSFFVSLLDAAERVAPVLTPRTMEDRHPLMTWPGP